MKILLIEDEKELSKSIETYLKTGKKLEVDGGMEFVDIDPAEVGKGG